MMRLSFVIALLILNSTGSFASQNACVAFYANRSLTSIPHSVVLELAQLHSDISEMPIGEDKSLALNDFKRKMRDIKRVYGDDVLAQLKIMLDTEAKTLVIKKEKEVKQKEIEQQAEDQLILKWTRIRTHQDTGIMGPFLSESEFFTSKDGNLALYDYKKKEFVIDADVSGGDADFKLKWDAKMLLTPSKQHLVIAQKKGVDVIDLKTNQAKRVKIATTHNRGFRGSKLSKDGKHLFLAGEDGESMIFTVPELKLVFSKTTSDYPHGNMIVESPNGQYVFFIRSNEKQLLYDIVNQREIDFPDLKAAGIYHVKDAVFSPDSKILTFTNHNNVITDFSLDTKKLQPTRLSVKHTEYLKVSADNKYIIAETHHITVEGNNKKPFRVIDHSTGNDITPDLESFNMLSPSGFRLTGADGHLLVFSGSKREIGKNTEAYYLYALDLNNMEFKVYPRTDIYLMHMYGTTPDGTTIFSRGNGGPLLEVY